jgi:hypothetical protein
MATFVHLTPERNVDGVLRAGIRPGPTRWRVPDGVYAMPTTPSFVVSHQWLRELKRGGQRTIWGVYFRVPNDQPVWAGHYNQKLTRMPAGEAAALLFRADPALGYEVIIPRGIAPGEIHRVRPLPQLVGWRYFPGAHGRRPCACEMCLRGEYGGRRTLERLGE